MPPKDPSNPAALAPTRLDRLFRRAVIRAAVGLVLLGGPGARAAVPPVQPAGPATGMPHASR